MGITSGTLRLAPRLPALKTDTESSKSCVNRGTFEVDTTDADRPTVKFDLTVDGKNAWQYTIVGKPVRWVGSTSLSPSALVEGVTEGVKNVLSKLGRIFG